MATKNTVTSVYRKSLFKGKSAIVTGGGSGIGKTITTELLFLGCEVLIAARNVDRLHEAAREIQEKLGPNAPRLEVLQCNIRKEDEVVRMVKHAVDVFGKIDFLVNNSGGQFWSPGEDLSLKGWNAVIETNLTGSWLVTREVYKQWMKDHGGSIVSIITNMFNGWPGMSHSGAARAGIENFTKSYAIEWAPAGVRINAVAPGSTIYSSSAAGNYKGAEQLFSQQIDRIPAKRLGKTDEVSAAVAFLLSPAASFISGATLRMDGAQSLYTTSSPWIVAEHDKSKPYTWDSDLQEQKEIKAKL